MTRSLAEYEDAALTALGCPGPGFGEVDRWADAYRSASERLTEGGRGPSGLAAPGEPDLAVAALIYGARTYWVASGLFRLFPPPPGALIELGAGVGPAALAAAELGHPGPRSLVDLSRARLELGRRMFHVAHHPEPDLVCADVASLRPVRAGCVVVPYLLNELWSELPWVERRRRCLALLRAWLATLEPAGRLYLVEPGTREACRLVMELGKELRAHVVAPCPVGSSCPRLGGPRDWCHFTWPLVMGPTARAVADGAARRHQEVHFSFLVLESEAERSALPDRVLENRIEGPGKRRVRVCHAGGEATVTVLRRNLALDSALAQAHPGASVRLDPAFCTSKGDGLRLESAAGLAVLSSLPEHL